MDAYGAGTINALNGTVDSSGGAGGTYKIALQSVGSNVFVCEGSEDGTTWQAIDVKPVTATGVGATAAATMTADGEYSAVVNGNYYFRVRCSSYVSGTTSVEMFATDALAQA
jgi:hypothetical protein